MCGIAGFLGRFEPQLLPAMTRRIAHRGPDDYGEYVCVEDAIALGHRRLAIIDLAPTGHQPMRSANGRHVIVFNGEIYNYRELRRTLESEGANFRGTSDTEVLLELFSRKGFAALTDLSGIFAFAIWDVESKELTVARDALGVKPLYYSETRAGFLFASELKALLAYSELPKEYDREALAYYLTYLWAPSPRTPLKAVQKLEPGTWLKVREGHIVEKGSFYRLPAPKPQRQSTASATEGLEQTLARVVERQLVSDVPVAAFLSGGVDSSLVAALAKQSLGEPLECFTIDLRTDSSEEDGMAADLPYARRVANELQLPLHEITVESRQVADDFEKIIEQLDEPQADPACLNAYYICGHARERQYKVMLSGTGGDDVFSGYRRHLALHMERWWSWLPRPLRRATTTASTLLARRGSVGRRIRKAFQYADLDPLDRLVSYFFWTHPQIVAQLLPDTPTNPATPLKSAVEARRDIVRPLDQMLFLEQRFFLADHNLPYTDKMSMAHGVEVRVPLIDDELVQYAATIPTELKQRGREGKWILKQAAARYLPSSVLSRPKTGFGVPLRNWLNGPLSPWVNELLDPATTRSVCIFDPAAVQDLLKKTARREIDGTYTLFALMCITLWHRRFFAG